MQVRPFGACYDDQTSPLARRRCRGRPGQPSRNSPARWDRGRGKPDATFWAKQPIRTYHKSWRSEFQAQNYQRNQTYDYKLVFTVEAFEEITLPAGTFKAFGIRRSSPNDRYMVWYEPALGPEVKRDWERYA